MSLHRIFIGKHYFEGAWFIVEADEVEQAELVAREESSSYLIEPTHLSTDVTIDDDFDGETETHDIILI